MTFVPRSSVLPRALWRPAMFFFAAAQLLLAFAPLAERRTASLAAHVEETGPTGHHAHDEANCVACIARAMLNASEVQEPRMSAEYAGGVSRFLSAVDEPSSIQAGHSQPRAPPLSQA